MKIKIRSFQTLLILSALLLLTFQTFFFTSCSNLFGENNSLPENSGASTESHLVTITGKVLLEGAIPSKLFHNSEGMDRTAFPQLPSLASLSFYIKATNKNDANDFYESNVDTGSNTYILTIPAPTQAEVVKTYNITITARNGTTDILTGTSEDIDLSLENTVFTKDITLHAISTSGSGGLDLNVVVDKEEGVSIVDSAFVRINDTNYPGSSNTDGFNFVLSTVLPAGVYPARFSFLKGTEEVYSFTQYVNIFSGLNTNTWVKNGNEPYFEESGSSTIVHITRALLNSYILTDFYVDKSRQTDNPDEPGYTTASGSFLNPVKSFEDAIAKINNPSANYSIHLKGSYQGCFSLPETLNSKMNSLTIIGESDLNTDGSPKDKLYGWGAVFGNETNFYNIKNSDEYTTLSNEGKIGSVLKIETSKPVTLTNLEISDGIAIQGAGLRLSSSNITINNLLVRNNKAQRAAGGILAVDSSVIMNDGKITMNSAKYIEPGNDPSNSIGGGITLNGNSSFIMNNGEISHNDSCQGGGIMLYSEDGQFTMNGGTITENHSTFAGGGIYNSGIATINRGTISQNSSEYDGGGVYNGGTLTITGGEISGNTAAEKGGAIYVSAGSTEYPLKLGQNAYIPAGPGNTNDILLFKNNYYNINAKITLIGALARHSATSPINLTFESYEIGLTAVIISESPNPATSLSQEVEKFAVVSNGSDHYYISGSEGKLKTGYLLTPQNIDNLIEILNSGSNGQTLSLVNCTASEFSSMKSKLQKNKLTKSIVLDMTDSGITSLNQNMFQIDPYNNPINVKKVILPPGITSIPKNAFWNCSVTEEVVMPNTVTELGEDSFGNSGIKTITLSSNLQTIGDAAFYDCNSLEEITIPASVTELVPYSGGSGDSRNGASPFYGCSKLKSITVEAGNTKYESFDGVLIEKETHKIMIYPPMKDGTEYITPSGITGFWPNSFNEISKLKKLTLSDEVTAIPVYFTGNNIISLEELTIGTGCTSIGHHAISYYIDKLEKVDFLIKNGWKAGDIELNLQNLSDSTIISYLRQVNSSGGYKDYDWIRNP